MGDILSMMLAIPLMLLILLVIQIVVVLLLDEVSPMNKLSEVEEIWFLVEKHFEGDAVKTSEWMHTTHPSLGNVTPVGLIMAGKASMLLEFVKGNLI